MALAPTKVTLMTMTTMMTTETTTLTTRGFYAGIGSRQTPVSTLDSMFDTARKLAKLGWTLRTGGATGADSAFLEGCKAAGGSYELWLPWKGFNSYTLGHFTDDCHDEVASHIHPLWSRGLRQGAKRLHSRNMGQILGADFNVQEIVSVIKGDKSDTEPGERSSFVLCWTPDGSIGETSSPKTGGTGTALRLAHLLGVPVVNARNLANDCFSEQSLAHLSI